jgi:hypothetical protein
MRPFRSPGSKEVHPRSRVEVQSEPRRLTLKPRKIALKPQIITLKKRRLTLVLLRLPPGTMETCSGTVNPYSHRVTLNTFMLTKEMEAHHGVILEQYEVILHAHLGPWRRLSLQGGMKAHSWMSLLSTSASLRGSWMSLGTMGYVPIDTRCPSIYQSL